MKKLIKNLVAGILETGAIIILIYLMGIVTNFIASNFWLIIPIGLFTLYLLITRLVINDKR